MHRELHTSLLGHILTNGEEQVEVVAVWRSANNADVLYALIQSIQTGGFRTITLGSSDWRSIKAT
jgi:hypothetical protein